MPEIKLEFSLEDRDMLRDTSNDVKRIISSQQTHGVEDEARFSTINERLTTLEKWQTRQVAIIGVIAFALQIITRMLKI